MAFRVGEGYSKVTIARDGTRYVDSSTTAIPARVLLMEQAMGALDGFSPLGPFLPPFSYPTINFGSHKKKIDALRHYASRQRI